MISLRVLRAASALLLVVDFGSPSHAIRGPGSLEDRLSAFIPPEMERRHLVAAVVTVIDENRVVFARGYGVEDLDTQTPVSPERTTFRVASVSKLVTASAAMKLVEQGTLDLDREVNAYLTEFQVAGTFPQPITLRHLLTHTSGLSVRFLASRSRARGEQAELGAYLSCCLPARFIAPGQIISYANHNMALAGFLVESASGRPFEEYVREEILQPLGMRTSGFGMEPALLDALAHGYVFSSGSFRKIPTDFRNEVPSGSFVTTASDMARFLEMFLAGGELDGRRVLEPTTTKAMLKRQFSHHPEMRGVGLGFWELEVDGLPFWGHDGDIVGWNARAILAPDRGAALFLAYTGTDTLKTFADGVTTAVFGESGSRHTPDRRARARRPRDDARLSGVFRWTRTVRKTPERFFTPYWLAQYRVRSGSSGEVELTNPLGILATSRWEPVSGGLFQETNGDRLLSFREEEGRITHLFLEGPIPMAFERVAWWESVPCQLGLIFLFLAVFFVVAGTSTFRLASHEGSARGSLPLILLASVANCLFLLAFPAVMGMNMFFTDLLPLPEFLVPPGNPAFSYGMPVSGSALLALPLLGAMSTGLAVARGLAGRRGFRSRMVIVAVLLFVAVEGGFLAFLHYWRLLGFVR